MSATIHTFNKQLRFHPLEREHIDSCTGDVMKMAAIFLKDLNVMTDEAPRFDSFTRQMITARRTNRACLLLDPIDVNSIYMRRSYFHTVYDAAIKAPRLSADMPDFPSLVRQRVIEDSSPYLSDIAAYIKKNPQQAKIENLMLFHPARHLFLQQATCLQRASALQASIESALQGSSPVKKNPAAIFQPLRIVTLQPDN